MRPMRQCSESEKGATAATVSALRLPAIRAHRTGRQLLKLFVAAALAAAAAGPESAIDPHAWPYYGRDAGGSRYSPLDQVNRGNVARLQVAWTYHSGDWSDGTRYPTRSAFECT